MNSTQSSSEQFGQHLKKIGGSEGDVSGSAYVVTEEDTVESVVSGMRMKQQEHGGAASKPSILHASAEVAISRRDENDPAHHPGTSQPGEYQLDIHCHSNSRDGDEQSAQRDKEIRLRRGYPRRYWREASSSRTRPRSAVLAC